MAGLIAMALLAAAGLLPILGQMRADYLAARAQPPAMTAQAAHAAVMAHLDDVDAAARRVNGAMHVAGVLPERRKTPRVDGAA